MPEKIEVCIFCEIRKVFGMITKLNMDFDTYNHVLTGLKQKGFGNWHKIFVCSRTVLEDAVFTDKIRVSLTEKDMFAVQDVMFSIEYDTRFAQRVEDNLEDFAAVRVVKDKAYWDERKAREQGRP